MSRTAALGDLCQLVRGVNYKREQASGERSAENLPVLRATNINGGLRLNQDLVYVERTAIGNDQLLRRGDIVIATSSGSASVVGKSALFDAEWEGAFGAFCGVLRPHGVDPRFLAYRISARDIRQKWTAAAVGTNINNLKRNHILDTVIRVPSLEEQLRIVAAIEKLFSHLDAGDISLRRAKGLAEVGRHRVFTASVGSGPFDLVTLGDIAEVVGGVAKDTKRQSQPRLVEVPYLRVANVQRGYLDLKNVSNIRVEPEKAEKLRLQPGDILFNEGGDRDKLGRGWVWEGQIPGCIHQNHVFRARLLERRFSPKFISLYANSVGRRWFETMGKQTTNLASLSLTSLKSFPLPDIPLASQERFVGEIERRDAELTRLLASIGKATAVAARLRESILAAAFTAKFVQSCH